MFEGFTDRARKVMALANQEAQRFNHEEIDDVHILLGLVKEGSGVGATVLKHLDVETKKLRNKIEEFVKPGLDMVTMGRLPQTAEARVVIAGAIEGAHFRRNNYVGTEHILFGLIKNRENLPCKVLVSLGVDLDVVKRELLSLVAEEVLQKIDGEGKREGKEEKPLSDKINRNLSGSDMTILKSILDRIKKIETEISLAEQCISVAIGVPSKEVKGMVVALRQTSQEQLRKMVLAELKEALVKTRQMLISKMCDICR